MQQNRIETGPAIVLVGAFGRTRRPAPVLNDGPSAVIVSLAAYRAARSRRKGHAWLDLDPSGPERG